MDVKEALIELRKGKKRKFSQSADLIINLRGMDLRKDNVNVVSSVPHKIKDKKVCGFFEKRSSLVDTITKIEFGKFKDKNSLKKIVKKYDFFVAEAALMPAVATTFGKVLGPAGKMPSPQLGILPKVDESSVKTVLERIAKSIKVRAKEASIKLSVGNEKMSDDEIISNVRAVFNAISETLPNKQENVKNVLLKFSMTKPIKLEIK